MATVKRGLLRAFQRDQKNDFANASGRALYEARAGQVLGTRADSAASPGELRWRSEFGSRLHLLRWRRNNAMTRALAQVYAQEALGRWDPRVVVTETKVDPASLIVSGVQKRALIVRCTLAIVDPNTRPTRALVTGLAASATILQA